VTVGDRKLRVRLPPASEIRLELEMTLFANEPSYAVGW
jgi:hypothetical protein